ncbi:MAG: recombination-associated protein RdgC [Gammaproteobacteria bacterium RIFCSPHIGHO2_12_FULL_40_19]|nr:MAG: recombination-associated protein RdgC [Gammaproteobacteria bacterium RIFCSPHIGHO2_12_FULL_40_19]
MWFKQASIFQLSRALKMDQSSLSEALAPLSFSPCLPSIPSSMGWVSPIDQIDGPLVYGSKRYWMICLQFEEKLLPAAVIRQALDEKVFDIEQKEVRVVRTKEKQSLKDEITQTLLPKAFTKKSRVHGFIDLEHQWLILNSTTPAKVERFMAFLKRAVTTVNFKSPDIKKPTAVMTRWLKERLPDEFGIGQSGVLQDPQQHRRVIRCQHQDLLATAIQALLKDGCEIAQLALTWKEQLQFVLTSDFSLKSIQFQEAVIALSKSDYTETPEQRFDADFVIMTEVLTQLVDALYATLSKNPAVLETA